MPSLLAAASSRRMRAAGVDPAARRLHSAEQVDDVDAQSLLADVGFLLVPGAPFDRAPAYLLVALRPRPTRSHYDPERIDYWSSDGGRAERRELEWPMPETRTTYSWGAIRIVDRVAASNRFVSFGGALSVSRDHDVHAALFKSDAPLLALGGHSGPADPMAANVAAFFATLRAAAGNDPSFANTLASLSPSALYAAFLERATAGHRGVVAEVTSPRLVSIIRSERRRLQSLCSTEAAAGADLARRLETPRLGVYGGSSDG